MSFYQLLYFFGVLLFQQSCYRFSNCQSANNGELQSLIKAPSNKTVYIGQTAHFYFESHSSCDISALINNEHSCPHYNTVGNITYVDCSISNAQLSDDGTSISACVFCGDNYIKSCFDPVYLQVIGPPHSPRNLTIEQYCNMIVINETILSEDTTEVYIEILSDNDIIYKMSEATYPVNISSIIFEDHHKLYKVIVYNKNPAGLSQPYEMDLLLFKSNFNISSSSLQVVDNKIVMIIKVKVNTSCQLSVPQQFNLSSNCAYTNFYQVSRTVIDESGLIDLSVIFHPNKKNCNVTISSGDYNLSIINQNTYEVQEVNIIPEITSTGYFSVNCTFLLGSLVKGCAIKIFNKNMDFVFNQNILRLSPGSSCAVDNISLSINGTYEIYIYVWDRYGRVNKSLVVMTKLVRVAISYQEDKNTSMSNNSTTSNKEPDKNDIRARTNNGSRIIVGCVLTGLIVILVVVIVIVCIVVMRYRRNKNGCQFNEFKMEYIEPIFDEEKQPQYTNDLEMENREHISDEEGQPQNDNITSYNNQIGSTAITINQERGEQGSENESRVEETTLEALPNNNELPNNNGDYISPESDTHDHDNNTLKRRSGKPEVPLFSDLSAIGLTDDFEVLLINNNTADVIEVRPEVDTQPHEQNIAISTNKPEHVTATGDPSSTYLTDNYEAQGLIETAGTEIISGDTQEIEISTNAIQPHVIPTSISQPVQFPTSESATFQTDNSETLLLNETTKENEIISTQPLVGQSVTSQPVQSLNSDSATFPTDGSEVPLLKPEDDTVDQFVYEHSYCVDETETTNQTTLMAPSINRQLSVISEKDEQVLFSENITTSSGGKPVVNDEAPSQTVYAPPTFQLLPPEQSTIVSTVPTTPTIKTQGFIFPTNETK